MGVHHFQLSMVPRSYYRTGIPQSVSEAEFEAQQESESGWWANAQPPDDVLTQLRRLLPKDKSWDDVEEFVADDTWGSDLRIWKTGNRVLEISFRFSPISDNWRLMERFLTIVRGADCVLREHATGALIEPEALVVQDRLSKSRAMRFLKDPAGVVVEAGKSQSSGVSDEFKRLADGEFNKNAVLFRKLAE